MLYRAHDSSLAVRLCLTGTGPFLCFNCGKTVPDRSACIPCTLHSLLLTPMLRTDDIQRRPLPYRNAFGLSPYTYNEFYSEDLTTFTFCKNAYRSLSLQVYNCGKVTGENIRLEGLILKDNGLKVMDTHTEFPEEFCDTISPLGSNTYTAPSIEIHLLDTTDYWMIQAEFGNARLGERIVSEDQQWFSSMHTTSVIMAGIILGENIPKPIPYSLEINFETLQRPMTIEDIDHAKPENEHI